MIVVGTTLAAFAMSKEDHWSSWLKNAEVLKESCDCKFFAAIQVDARGLEPFKPLLDRLAEVGGEYWTYSLDDGRTQVTTANRLRHLTTGQNLVMEYAQCAPACSHLLFMAADCMPPDDVFPKMLEMNHPLVAPYIETYQITGPLVPGYPYRVMDCMASAACIFISKEVFRRIRWRWENGSKTDDPCLHEDAINYLGIKTYVRADVQATHFPKHVPPVEARGNDMRVVRE